MWASRHQQGAWYGRIVTQTVGKERMMSRCRRDLPAVLQTPFLLGFSALATVLCLLVGLFWQFSQRSDGIRVSTVNHYVLVYSPTAVLIWLVAFWRQVDFHIKDLTPWNELYIGTSRASRSILLDYVSILQITAFWRAVRNRHIPVVITTLGFTLLKIAILSSTGFLFVQTYHQEHDLTTRLESKFLSPFINSGNDTALFDKSLLYTTYGTLAQNLSQPFGLGNGLAYATFDPKSGFNQATNLTGEVDGFVPSFQCLPADLTAILPETNITDAFPNTLVEMNNTTCSLRAQNVDLYTLNPRLFRCPARQLSGVVSSIDCPPSVFNADGGAYKLFAMADFRYFQTLDETDSSAQLSTSIVAKKWSTEVAQISGMICRLSHSIQPIRVNVTGSESQSFTSQIVPANATRLENFSDDDFDLLFRSSISASDGILGDRIVEGYALEYPDPMLKMMALVPGGSYEDLLDHETMSRAASKVSNQLGAQIAHQYLRSNNSAPIVMRATSPVSHISVAAISAYILLVSLGVVAIMGIYLLLLTRCYVMGSDESTLMRAMLLVPHHGEVTDDLISSQSCTEKHLRETLKGCKVHLGQDHNGGTSLRLDERPTFTEHNDCKLSWWNPVTVSKLVLIGMFLSTLIAIVVLEVLQRVSESDQGFATLPPDTTQRTIFTHYIPAFLFLLLASTYTCLDFNSLLLSPFQQLRISVDVGELRQRSQLGQVPIFAWFHALRNKSWGAASSTSAALIGSLLTIVVSGLFEVDMLYSSRTFVVTASDSFVPNWVDSSVQDSGASLISSLTENLHFPYPSGTFDEIAYAHLQMLDFKEQVTNSTIVLDAPVWRAHLMCQRLSNTDVDLQSSPSPFQKSIVINASYTLPAECLRGGSNGTDSVLQFIQSFNFPTSHNSTYLGQLLDLHVGPYDPILGSAEGENVPSAMNENPLGCPSIGLVYGFVDLESSAIADGTVPDTVAVEVCYQQLQSVQTTLIFQNADFNLDTVQPPEVNETSIKYISVNNNSASLVEDTEMATAFPFRIQGHMDNTFVMFNSTHDNIFGELSNTGDTVDTFFQGVLFGRTPVPVASLKLENEDQTSQIQQGILAFYRRYMAQVISLNMRSTTGTLQSDTNNTTSLPVYIANAPTAIVTNRIVQNNTSKIVLQVMLGVMLVCGVYTALTVQMHNLLPACANPCTIWGQMSLWAGSSIYETTGNDASGAQDDGKDRINVVERSLVDEAGDVFFKLGWWTMRDGRQRYGIDVIRKDL